MTRVFATEPLFSPRICAFVQAKDFSSCEALEKPRDAMDGLHTLVLIIYLIYLSNENLIKA